jgi:subtilisin family serine protease
MAAIPMDGGRLNRALTRISLLLVLALLAGIASRVPAYSSAPSLTYPGAPDAPPLRVEMTVLGDPDRVLGLLDSLGGVVEVRARNRIQALVPPERLEVLEAARALLRVEPPAVLLPIATSSSALERIGADRWHDAGFSGHGVEVAVIDAGFSGYEVALGDTLPPVVAAQSFRADGDVQGGTAHGLRAAEIVHAVAPGARLFLLNFATITEFAAAVDFAVAEQVDVISFSLGFIHNGPGDGSGAVNEIVSRATEAGIAWAVASGNWAQQHWSGRFTDDDGDSVHEFAPGVQKNGHRFTAGDLIVVSLRWDDRWGAACSDYDLELFGPDGALVRASRTIQACSGNPVEALQVLATQTGRYAVRIIEAQSETPKLLDLMMVGSPDRGLRLDVSVPQRSLSEPADHRQAITVGAVDSEAGVGDAPFSSRGPTPDGRAKPEVLGPTGLSGVEGPTFSGTSAAAPHVAGVLALLKEAFPQSSGEELRSRLLARSPLVEPLPDATPGARVANLGSLSGLGPLLPVGSEEALLLGTVSPAGGLALVAYHGPDGYPLRFAHRLAGGQEVEAAFRLDVAAQRFRVFIRGAPAFVNGFERLRNGDIIILRLAPAAGS